MKEGTLKTELLAQDLNRQERQQERQHERQEGKNSKQKP
jgi:hypothetical protein